MRKSLIIRISCAVLAVMAVFTLFISCAEADSSGYGETGDDSGSVVTPEDIGDTGADDVTGSEENTEKISESTEQPDEPSESTAAPIEIPNQITEDTVAEETTIISETTPEQTIVIEDTSAENQYGPEPEPDTASQPVEIPQDQVPAGPGYSKIVNNYYGEESRLIEGRGELEQIIQRLKGEYCSDSEILFNIGLTGNHLDDPDFKAKKEELGPFETTKENNELLNKLMTSYYERLYYEDIGLFRMIPYQSINRTGSGRTVSSANVLVYVRVKDLSANWIETLADDGRVRHITIMNDPEPAPISAARPFDTGSPGFSKFYCNIVSHYWFGPERKNIEDHGELVQVIDMARESNYKLTLTFRLNGHAETTDGFNTLLKTTSEGASYEACKQYADSLKNYYEEYYSDLFGKGAAVIGNGFRCELTDGNSIKIVAKASAIESSWLAEMAKSDLFSKITITGGNEALAG